MIFTQEELNTFTVAQLESIPQTADKEYNNLVEANILSKTSDIITEEVFVQSEVVVEVEEEEVIVKEEVTSPKKKVAIK